MRLVEALADIADYARSDDNEHSMPTIRMPRWALQRLIRCIEADIGGKLDRPYDPFTFDGIRFEPTDD
jgi:hypothetical protein